MCFQPRMSSKSRELATQAIKCSWALSGPLTHVEAFKHTPNPVPTQARTAMPVHHLSHIRLLPKLFPQNHGSGRAVVWQAPPHALVSGQGPCISRNCKHALSDPCCGPLTSGHRMAVAMVLGAAVIIHRRLGLPLEKRVERTIRP